MVQPDSEKWGTWRTAVAALGMAVPAAALRWSMRARYYGHEEEDWGNLEIVRGILETRFQFIETEHMPLFTTISAYVAMAAGDSEVAAELVAVFFGAATVALVTWIGIRMLSPAAGLVAGVLVMVQPESLLYAASPLRESTYAALLLLGLALVGAQQYGKSAVALSAAFLTRFNAAFTVLPALVLHAWWVRGRERRDKASARAAAQGDPDALAAIDRLPGLAPARGSLVVAAVLAGVTALWARYYASVMDTWRFWGGVMERNTGDAVADLSTREHVAAVGEAVLGLSFRVLPGHVGWAVVPLGFVGAAWVLRGRSRDPDNARWLLANAATTLGLLLVTAVVSTYPSDHNLYWKWLAPTVPFFALLGAHGAVEGLRSVPLPQGVPRRPAVVVLALGLAAATALGYLAETDRQITRSDRWYGTQIRLCEWVERALPPDAGVLTTGIPTSFLSRRTSDRRVLSWHAEDLPRTDAEAFGAWLVEHRVDLVVWMNEEWTGAPQAAPDLAAGEPTIQGPVTLVPVAREDGYGFIAYRVDGTGRPPPSSPPPPEAGGLPSS